MKKDTTIVISCAGMGTRLGIGCTKALVEIIDKPLILHQLELLNDYDDICIVVGYQAEQVIDVVTKFRKDIRFAFNYDYKTTGTAASLSKALLGSRKYIVTLDGDLLVHPDDLKKVINFDGECICGCVPTTDNPVLMETQINNNLETVIEFSREHGNYEWTGLAKIETNRLVSGNQHVYQMLEPLLPLPLKVIRSQEIDTINDYEKAINWIKNNYINEE